MRREGLYLSSLSSTSSTFWNPERLPVFKFNHRNFITMSFRTQEAVDSLEWSSKDDPPSATMKFSYAVFERTDHQFRQRKSLNAFQVSSKVIWKIRLAVSHDYQLPRIFSRAYLSRITLPAYDRALIHEVPTSCLKLKEFRIRDKDSDSLS